MGNMPDWKTRYSTKLFAEKVMPTCATVAATTTDDNRWWIHPLDGRVRPATRRSPTPAAIRRCRATRWRAMGTRPRAVVTVVTTRRGIEATCSTGGPAGARRSSPSTASPAPSAANRCWSGWPSRLPRVRPRVAGLRRHRRRRGIDDMLDFALHGADVVEALGLAPGTAHLVGHSMGAMIAAEMAALAPYGYARAGPDRPARPLARRGPDPRHLHAAPLRVRRRCCSTMPPSAPRSSPAAASTSTTARRSSAS